MTRMTIFADIQLILIKAAVFVSFMVHSLVFASQVPEPKEENNIPYQIRTLPGTGATPMELTASYQKEKTQKGKNYKPRTRHLDKNGWALYTNRLFLESSPYLLQHAHNPVNWYPWGDEAFETARKKNLPVLLSVGYSTCHWCHVMEEESFEDLEIAAYINQHYVPIKVDREERPDIDAIYMTAVQSLTGSGGWPMTVWLTPDRKPFYGGTYFPARDGGWGVSTGFLTILEKISGSYSQKADLIAKTSDQLTQSIQSYLQPARKGALPNDKIIENSIQQLKNGYDTKYGGMTGAPKFPSTMPVRLLIRHFYRSPDRSVLEMIEHTLVKMANGGIYDHVGGGFHRYATDEKWLVPHFEKMLYDNALMVLAYLEGYQITGNLLFKQVVMETLAYIQIEMTSPEGGFYSATDADSRSSTGESEEGWFFTWTPKEIENVLGEKEAKIVKAYFNVTPKGHLEGRSIFHVKTTLEQTAGQMDLTENELAATVQNIKTKLYNTRSQRPAPLRDEKILTAWNGLMISAFARAGFVLNHPDYVDTARKAARFIADHLVKDHQLLRSYKDEKSYQTGFLNDYAFYMAGLLDLFEADPDPEWIKTVLALEQILEQQYEDKENGGFYKTPREYEALIARQKPGVDGALPSGNAIAAMNLLRLSNFLSQPHYHKRAENVLAAFSSQFSANPALLAEMMLAFDVFSHPAGQIVLVANPDQDEEKDRFLKIVQQTYLPNYGVVQVQTGDHAQRLQKIIPSLEGKIETQGKVVAYVCKNGVCRLPAVSVDTLKGQLTTEK